jgi:hypothetical protein
MNLEHDLEKPALGLRPGGRKGFSKQDHAQAKGLELDEDLSWISTRFGANSTRFGAAK